MTKTSLLLLALAAGAPLLAQAPGLSITKGDSDITIYGILDVGVASVAHTLNFDSEFPATVNPQANKFGNGRALGMFNGGISQTRWGLKGGTGLVEGWKAVFTLESAINVPSGNVANGAVGMAQNKASVSTGNMSADTAINGQLFNRNCNFGVSSDTYGTLTFGRHTSFMLDTIPGYDALQGAQLFTPIGFSGSYGGGGATDDSRIDNSIKYKVKVGDFNFGLAHKFGGVSGAASAQMGTEAVAGYEHGPLGIQLLYQAFNDAFSVSNPAAVPTNTTVGTTTVTTYAQPLGTIALSAYNTTALMLTARYKVGDLAIKGGYEREDFENPSNPGPDSQITSLFGQVVNSVNTAPYNVTVNGNAVSAKKTQNVWWLGVAYDWTTKFNTAISYYNVAQDDWSLGTIAAGAASNSNSKQAGTSKFYSALVDYHITKAFDVYAGYMNNKVDGGLSVGYQFTSNSITALGVRYMF